MTYIQKNCTRDYSVPKLKTPFNPTLCLSVGRLLAIEIDHHYELVLDCAHEPELHS